MRFQDSRADGRHAGFLHGEVDTHALAGLFALIQRQQQGIGHVVAHRVIHVVIAGPPRWAVFIASQIGHPAGGIDGTGPGSGPAPRASVSEGGGAQGDDPGIQLAQALMVEAVPCHGAGAEVIRHDVAFLSQLEENFFTPGIGHFQTKALLIPGAKVGQVSTLVPPFFAGLPAGEGPGLAVLQVDHTFHADDLGAQIR